MGVFMAERYRVDMTGSGQVSIANAFIARINFGKRLLVGCENVEYCDQSDGQWKSLTPDVPNWIDLIEPQWIAMGVLVAFESANAELDFSKK
jgi:hypothetical protein